MRALVIGEAPNRTSDATGPIAGHIAIVLAVHCGMSVAEFKRTFVRMNLLANWPGAAGKGSAFDLKAARRLAGQARRRLVRGRIVVLLGKRVAAAFGVRQAYLVEQDLFGASVFVVPHPSGVNRWYNAPAHRTALSVLMHRIVDEVRSRS